MAEEKNVMFRETLVIEPQNIHERNRPTVFDLTHAYRVKVVSKEGEEYTITNYGSSVHDYNIGGGIFGEESTNTHSIWNVVGNIQEVFLTLASGEEYVNVRIGNSGAYVRISVAKVQI